MPWVLRVALFNAGVLIFWTSSPVFAAFDFEAFLRSSPEQQVELLKQASNEDQLNVFRSIKALIDIDPLTGLNNRRALDRALGTYRGRMGVATSAAYISFDLDHFKKVNDTYGHAAGDQVLAAVGLLVTKSIRDSVYRIGGEEFQVIVENGTLLQAGIIGHRLRKEIEDLRFSLYPELRVTASFGVAAGKISGRETHEALSAASDRALYAAKDAGRNRVYVASRRGNCIPYLKSIP